MKIVLLEPYLTGSHRMWAEGLARYSAHDVQVLGLSGNFWKWRMHGGAVTLAGRFLDGDFQPDVLLATDMLDLTTFLALTRRQTARIPTAIYFHENQLTYPWSPDDRDVRDRRDRHYGFINYASALSADAVLFNSEYHRQSFLSELPRFLRYFPDHRNLETVAEIESNSRVLPLGLDLRRFDAFRPRESSKPQNKKPLILWSHRWEYDKNPEDFFRALRALDESGMEFEVAILGECFSRKPAEFLAAEEWLGPRLVHFGFVDCFEDYVKWLWRADVLPVTSYQDFFGASVAEAAYCGCLPLLPGRLAYAELLPESLIQACFYNNFEDLVDRLKAVIERVSVDPALRKQVRLAAERFDWGEMAPKYDGLFDGLTAG